MKQVFDIRSLNTNLQLLAQIAVAAICFLAIGSVAAQPAPRMGISPDRYQVTFDERGGETQSLLVQNLSDEPLSLSLSVSNWVLNESNQIAVAPPTETSLDQWIVINPLHITIPPGSPQTIRWAIMPRLKPEPGEYRAIIFIEEDGGQSVNSDATEVRMKMRYGMPIYAQVGESKESAELHGISITGSGNRLSVDLTNDGNVHARLSGNYGIWPTDEFPGTDEALKLLKSLNPENQDDAEFFASAMPPSVILPGDRRALPLDINLTQAGEYTIQLNAAFAQLQFTDTLNFTKIPDDGPETFRVASLPTTSRLVGSAE